MLSELFPGTIEIGGATLTCDLEADLSINSGDLDGEFMNQALLFAKYSTAFDIATKVTGRVKAELEALEAQVDRNARMEAVTNGVKLTETMAKLTVKGNKDYLEKHAELLQAQQITGLLKSAKDAMLQRKDMLVQLGCSQRQERGANITMKEDFIKGGRS